MIWQIGERRLLVDDSGLLFARLDKSPPASVAELPVVLDARADSARLAVGLPIDPVDFDVARRLASLTPASVGSAATGLAVSVTDDNGFVVSSVPESWVAVFGFYGQSLRTPDLIPGQVQLLGTLLLGREPNVALVILAGERDGTFYPKSSPSPPASEAP
jgi:hypothetical protein